MSSHKCALLLLLLLLLSNFFFVVAVPALAFFALPSSSSLSLIPYVACLLLEFYVQIGILEKKIPPSIFFSICLSFFSTSFGKCRFRALASFFIFLFPVLRSSVRIFSPFFVEFLVLYLPPISFPFHLVRT